MRFSSSMLENLRPALAGLIVDHEVGRKEAYATFINLVERGYVDIVSSRPPSFQISKRSGDGLLPFERLVLEELAGLGKPDSSSVRRLLERLGGNANFQQSVIDTALAAGLYVEDLFQHWSRQFKKIRQIVQYVDVHWKIMFVIWFVMLLVAGVVNQYRNQMPISDIFPLLLVFVVIYLPFAFFSSRDQQRAVKAAGRYVPYSRYDVPKMPFMFQRWLNNFFTIFGLSIFSAIVLRYIPILSGLSTYMLVLPLLLSPVYWLIFIIGWSWQELKYRSVLSSEKLLEKSVSELGLAQKGRYLELLAWLQANPLKNYRWSNEFLPYAVAFGL